LLHKSFMPSRSANSAALSSGEPAGTRIQDPVIKSQFLHNFFAFRFCPIFAGKRPTH
jgi:hypothetical protein